MYEPEQLAEGLRVEGLGYVILYSENQKPQENSIGSCVSLSWNLEAPLN